MHAAHARVCLMRPRGFSKVGVHYGGFFLQMALGALPEERLWVCDVFDEQHKNLDMKYAGSFAKFRGSLRRFGLNETDVAINKKSTLELKQSDFDGVPKFRMFSVDAGHTLPTVYSDMFVANDVLAEGGIVFVDDFGHHEWSEVGGAWLIDSLCGC